MEVKKIMDLRKIYKEIELNFSKFRKQATILAMASILGLTGCTRNPNRVDTTELPTKTIETSAEETEEDIMNKIQEQTNEICSSFMIKEIERYKDLKKANEKEVETLNFFDTIDLSSYKGDSLVDALALNGYDSSLEFRKELAAYYGIELDGSAEKNLALLNLLRGKENIYEVEKNHKKKEIESLEETKGIIEEETAALETEGIPIVPPLIIPETTEEETKTTKENGNHDRNRDRGHSGGGGNNDFRRPRPEESSPSIEETTPEETKPNPSRPEESSSSIEETTKEEPVPSTEDTQPVPSTEDTQPVPSTEETKPNPSKPEESSPSIDETTKEEPVPSTEDTQPVPSTEETKPNPSKPEESSPSIEETTPEETMPSTEETPSSSTEESSEEECEHTYFVEDVTVYSNNNGTHTSITKYTCSKCEDSYKITDTTNCNYEIEYDKENNLDIQICKTCGYTKKAEHKHKSDGTIYFKEENRVGYEYKICDVCDLEYDKALHRNHDFEVVSYDDEMESLKCTICKTEDERKHLYDEDSISVDDDGNMVYECANEGCDYSYTKTHTCILEKPGKKHYLIDDEEICYTITQKCLDPDCDKVVVTEYKHNFRTRPNGNQLCRECSYEIEAKKEDYPLASPSNATRSNSFIEHSVSKERKSAKNLQELRKSLIALHEEKKKRNRIVDTLVRKFTRL